MSSNRKTILIKSSSSTGLPMASNAEFHTLFYFCKWLSKESNIVISGIENKSHTLGNLEDKNVLIIKPFIRYLYLKKIRAFLHIPVSIINTLVDAQKIKPDLMICLGGVFYNGLGILIAGKLLGIKIVIRSAEDHIGLSNFYKAFSVNGIYSKFRALISRIVIQNSEYFLTVGYWSIDYFRKIYRLSSNESFMIPGPIDNSITQIKGFNLSTDKSKRNLLDFYDIPIKKRTILFIGSHKYKGTNEMVDLLKKIKKNNLEVKVLWISNSKSIRKKISFLKYSDYVKFLDPVGRCNLVNLIKGVDFLFWSTSLGVGYGQIMLESILCWTEVLCYRPIGDAKILVGNNYYSNIDEIILRLKNQISPKNISIPEWMSEECLKKEHIILFNNVLKN